MGPRRKRWYAGRVYLTEFQLYNYKSFENSGPLTLKPGFNIITGQNNAGKTALLEALGLRFDDKPHRSRATVPSPGQSPAPGSWARLRFKLLKSELDEFFKTQRIYFIPTSQEGVAPAQLLRLVKDQLHLEVEVKWSHGLPGISRLPSFGVYRATQSQHVFVNAPEGEPRHLTSWSGDPPELGLAIAPELPSRIFSFRAERLSIGQAPFGNTRELAPDASNLPQVLNVLQGSPTRFERYNSLVKRVFPQVERVTVRPANDRNVEILVWSDPEREDLAVPLSESGTGLGQVLAMLYILVTADAPRIILIDEPNSFLHPGAVHALLEILREHPQHQYIVSTHSAEVISASNPATVHVLRKKASTQVERINASGASHLRAILLEVGSRLSDVFGADGVVWVEGKTGEQCYPILARMLLKRSLGRVAIVGVRPAGDVDAGEAVLRIYERLAQGAALLPPSLAFIFDRGLRPEQAREDVIRESKGLVSFLSRRTYENYLLHSGAIAAVLNTLSPFIFRPTTAEKIEAWIQAHASDERYYRRSDGRDFLQDVNAPKFLSDLFSDLSYQEVEYIKTEHSVAITEWLIEHDPGALQEVAALLATKLPSDGMTASSPAGQTPAADTAS